MQSGAYSGEEANDSLYDDHDFGLERISDGIAVYLETRGKYDSWTDEERVGEAGPRFVVYRGLPPTALLRNDNVPADRPDAVILDRRAG